MMSWCGGWGLADPTRVMRQDCTEAPRWSGGRGQFAQTDSVIFGKKETSAKLIIAMPCIIGKVLLGIECRNFRHFVMEDFLENKSW